MPYSYAGYAIPNVIHNCALTKRDGMLFVGSGTGTAWYAPPYHEQPKRGVCCYLLHMRLEGTRRVAEGLLGWQ